MMSSGDSSTDMRASLNSTSSTIPVQEDNKGGENMGDSIQSRKIPTEKDEQKSIGLEQNEVGGIGRIDGEPPMPTDGIDWETPMPTDGIDWEKFPKQRKARVTSVFVFFLTTAGIFVYGFINNTETECKAHNRTDQSYKMQEKKTYPVFFHAGLGLLGIILGVFVDRLCQFIEEMRQYKIRYNSDWRKVFKSCFSGISWHRIGVVVLIVVVAYVLGRKTSLKVADIIYILGGIGIGPLLIHLLYLNTESEVDISRLLEETKMSSGYTLAWSYYSTYFEQVGDDFNQEILKRKLDLKNRKAGLERGELRELSLDKIILLLTPDDNTIRNVDYLVCHDETITKLKKPNDNARPNTNVQLNPYSFDVYQLKQKNGDKVYLAMRCVRGPTKALFQMQKLRCDELAEQKRFYNELTKLLENAPSGKYTKRGLLVPVTVKVGQYNELKQGGLNKIILAKVNSSSKSDAGGNQTSSENKGSKNNNATISERESLIPPDSV